MTIVLAQATFAHDSGLPEDQIVNTWHFDAADPNSLAQQEAIVDMVVDFYNGQSSNGGGLMATVGSFLSSVLSGQMTVKLYDLEEPKPRVPIYSETVAVAVSNGTPYPSELAVVLSIRGSLQSGMNMARRRNRKFLGPLSASAGTVSGSTVRPSTACQDTLLAAAHRMKVASDANANISWQVYSDGAKQPGTEQLLAPTSASVQAAWVDNAFDVQRRRGEAATSRKTNVSDLVGGWTALEP